MPLNPGLYEQLITDLLADRLRELPGEQFFIRQQPVEPEEAARYLTQHLSRLITYALQEIPAKQRPLGQIDLANKIIRLLAEEIRDQTLDQDLIHAEGKLLEAIIHRLERPYADLVSHVNAIMPQTRLTQSELFTGNRAGVSMDSELKKEIASSDELCWLVSFIKFSGIRIFLPELREFTKRGSLRIITTSYMGATDLKAVETLAQLPNTEIKVSYNPEHERLHAKAYLFLRKSGFDTGYIGSSNLSRSALTNGLEWNMKITTREVPQIIEKFKKTFDTYWGDSEFEAFNLEEDRERLQRALRHQQSRTFGGSEAESNQISAFFHLSPHPFQKEILDQLHTERTLHNRKRNLVVAATGTGKTVISAFDFKRYLSQNPGARFLFIAHRKEILRQSRDTFRHVLRDANFGELWVDGLQPERFETVFASVQTFNAQIGRIGHLPANFYDFIIIDEVHHLTASSYRTILERFDPDILLGLTATPERMDGGDITEDFDQRIAAEIRLPEALNRKLLCPFQYFGVTDSVDLRDIPWRNGKYDAQALTTIYTGQDLLARQRAQLIMDSLDRYCTDPNRVRALGFCVTIAHAEYMAAAFQEAGYRAGLLVGNTSREERDQLRKKLQRGELNYLFVVDVFNEGVDIPEIDTVLFLRPTESLTIFLQQLGRGLRLADEKEVLTVLDFVGNSRPEYDFEHKFRALIGKTRRSVLHEMEQAFPHLPLGCSINLEKQAREYILENIRNATSVNRPKMVQKIQLFRHQSTKPLTWANFMEFHHMEAPMLYKYKLASSYIGWNRLCVEAGVREEFSEPMEHELSRFISQRLLSMESSSYFRFIEALLDAECDLTELIRRQHSASEREAMGFKEEELNLLGLMLHYDIWQETGPDSGANTLRESLLRLQLNPVMLSEIRDVVRYRMDQIHVIERPIEFEQPFPLQVHGRYNRDQILVAMRLHRWERKSSNREGVANNEEMNAEALFVTLNKSEADYSSTTMYEDYAVNETTFHWQSQNSAVPERGKGLSYIEHRESGKRILMFVREHNRDQYGNTMAYVFLGECEYRIHTGSRPMNIRWELKDAMPNHLLNESRKLAVG
ncbi:MAG: DUF3427 domain-containing protein [Balneolaceae bacterium]|nr:MAG: DUF3427 domain-containing protein [Balneolaceae bacterium]